MIGSLRGILLERAAGGEVLIEVHGLGYRVQMGPTASVAVGEVGGEVFVHIYHHFREDAQTLYGFRDSRERRTFEVLLSAHGVGPALALAILSVHDPDALAVVVAAGDLDALCLVPGVGKKTAQRLLVELRDALDVPVGEPGLVGQASADGSGAVLGDVREALIGLGYGPDEIREALAGLPSDGDASDLLKQALTRLAVPK